MNKKYRFGLSIGSASLLLIFAVLCLTLFASLTLISAKNEMALTAKFAESATQYYEAENTAVQDLQQIESVLSSASEKPSVSSAKEFIKTQCSKSNFTYKEIDNKIYIIFNENINSLQTLHIVIKVNSVYDISYEILQWKKINSNEENIDDSINVYK